MRTSWRMPALAATALVVGAACGGGTVALWKTAGNASPAVIVSGNLDVTATSATWNETSPDVKGSGRTIDPTTFLVRRGDTVAMTQNFRTALQGDNLSAEISVDWTDPASLPPGVTGTYEVRDGQGRRLGQPAPVGEALTLSDADQRLSTDDGGREDDMSIRVSLDFAGLSDRFGADSPVQVADLGRFTFTLDQVRAEG